MRKVGATQEEPVDVRIISATHQNLAALVDGGRFRQDLFYRLNVIELAMPPLRECREDIAAASPTRILERLARQNGAPRRASTPTALRGARALRLPGQRARAREHPRARARALRRRADQRRGPAASARRRASERDAGRGRRPASGRCRDYLDEVERKAILEALGKTGFNRTAAAKLSASPSASCATACSASGITRGGST